MNQAWVLEVCGTSKQVFGATMDLLKLSSWHPAPWVDTMFVVSQSFYTFLLVQVLLLSTYF